MSADNVRLYLSVGERERRRLAQSLRKAAKAYEENDENAAEALSTGTSMPDVAPRLAGKGKRVQQDDDALFTENRPWAEAIIGRRPAADNAGGKR